MKVKYIWIFFGSIGFVLSSCDKDEVEPEPEIADTTIYNTLIAGGGTTSFQRTIGGQKLDALYSVKQTSDGGYVFCGLTENEGASERDVLLLRTNAAGETVWMKLYSDAYTDQGWYVETTSDNGFILAATAALADVTSIDDSYHGQLIKVEADGNQTWKQSFTFGDYTHFNVVRQTTDGGYIVCGTEYNSAQGILLKTDANGTESWRKSYGDFVEFFDMCVLNDGGFIFCGSKKQNQTTDQDIYLVRTNANGDTLWTQTYGDALENIAASISETASGDFILCGYNYNPGNSGYAKLVDANGNEIWHTDFLSQGIQALDDIIQTNDNQFIAVGRDGFGSSNNASLQKMDNNGNSVWINWFQPSTYHLLNEIQQTSDNGFIVAGYVFGEGYILKTDQSGN